MKQTSDYQKEQCISFHTLPSSPQWINRGSMFEAHFSTQELYKTPFPSKAQRICATDQSKAHSQFSIFPGNYASSFTFTYLFKWISDNTRPSYIKPINLKTDKLVWCTWLSLHSTLYKLSKISRSHGLVLYCLGLKKLSENMGCNRLSLTVKTGIVAWEAERLTWGAWPSKIETPGPDDVEGLLECSGSANIRTHFFAILFIK